MNYKGYRHLTLDKRYKIEALLRAKHTPTQIAEIVGCCRATVYNEIKRATYLHTDSETLLDEKRYAPEIAHQKYRDNLKRKGRLRKIDSDDDLKTVIEYLLVIKKYSPQATLIEIKNSGIDFKVEIKSVTTLYKYIREGVFESVSMENCPYKKEYKKKQVKRAKGHSKGTSIEDRPSAIDDREEFGHWEMDTVHGKRNNKKTLLVLTERKTRYEICEVLKACTADEVRKALDRLEKKYGSLFYKVFKSITVDNGVEFSNCEAMEKALYRVGKRTKIYYCHPYCSSERGSNENHNKLVRRHAPKGSDFDKIMSKKLAKKIQEWMNQYPRMMFDGQCAEVLYQEEIARLTSG